MNRQFSPAWHLPVAWYCVPICLVLAGCNVSDISRILPQPDEFKINKTTYRYGPQGDARIMSALDSVEQTDDVGFRVFPGGLVCLQYEGITNFEADFELTCQTGAELRLSTRSHRIMWDRDAGLLTRLSHVSTSVLEQQGSDPRSFVPITQHRRVLNPGDPTRVRVVSQGSRQTLILDCDTVAIVTTRKLASDAMMFAAEGGTVSIRDFRLTALKVVGHIYRESPQ